MHDGDCDNDGSDCGGDNDGDDLGDDESGDGKV